MFDSESSSILFSFLFLEAAKSATSSDFCNFEICFSNNGWIQAIDNGDDYKYKKLFNQKYFFFYKKIFFFKKQIYKLKLKNYLKDYQNKKFNNKIKFLKT